MRVMGIDPGTLVAGYGVVEENGGALRAVAYGVIRPPRGGSYEKRLLHIYEGIRKALHVYQPDTVAVEESFYGKSVRSAMRLGEGRAVALLGAAQERVPVTSYAPTVVKKAVVGSGIAHKSQVQEMIKCILDLQRKPPADASDALAIAVCHCHRAASGEEREILAEEEQR